MGYRFRIEFVSDLDKDTGGGAELDALFKTPAFKIIFLSVSREILYTILLTIE